MCVCVYCIPRCARASPAAIFNPRWVYFRIGRTKNSRNAFRCIPPLYLDPALRNTRAYAAPRASTNVRGPRKGYSDTRSANATGPQLKRREMMRNGKIHPVSCALRTTPVIVSGPIHLQLLTTQRRCHYIVVARRFHDITPA